jgi:hypothetical protein
MAAVFPGDLTIGLLSANETARAEFFARFSDLACPALEPEQRSVETIVCAALATATPE